MKTRYALLILITMLLSTAVYSQRRPTIDERMKKMDKELNLSDEQYSKIKNILEEQHQQFRKMRDESNGDREQMREKAMKMMKNTDDKICEILNKEQQEKYRKQQEERRKNREGERPRN